MSDAGSALHVPQGELVRARVVDDLAAPLERALEERFTGYVVLEPGGSLLLGDDIAGLLTFADGVPVVAYCETTDEGGVDALAALAGPGPCAVERYELPRTALEPVHDTPSFRVPPGAPAEELAGAPTLAARTRDRAPDERLDDGGGSAVAAFLRDEERIAEIQREARAEAKQRAAEWGLDDQLDER